MVSIKSDREIALMREAGRATAQILRRLMDHTKVGVSTIELDELAESACSELGVKPAFKGYLGYKHCLCVSVNDVVVHGVPSGRRLVDGDIVGLDFGVSMGGYFGDSAVTIPVGSISPAARNLIQVTRESLFRGIEQMRPGNRLFDISYAVQKHVEDANFAVVREFVGHGIGLSLHEDPQIPNFGPKGKGPVLRAGMVFAIEPMVNVGREAVRIEEDGWTAVTADGSLSAHFEHTVAITVDGPEILTLCPSGEDNSLEAISRASGHS